MASAQSSQNMWHGRGHQPQILGNARPRHRSESRRLSDRRCPVKTAARKLDQCPGALHEGDPVQVFSRSADKWVDGEFVKLLEVNFVRVEYEVGEYWCGKCLHIHSRHLVIPSIMACDEQQQQPVTYLADGECRSCSMLHDSMPSLETLASLSEEDRSGCSSGSTLSDSMPSLGTVSATLREFFSLKDIEGNRRVLHPSTFRLCCDEYVHVESGVSVHFRPIRMVGTSLAENAEFQVLFHYTQKCFFDRITASKDLGGVERLMLRASQDLSRDCDFGAGVYATDKGPDEFHDGLKGILMNNYPRKGPWGFAGEPGEQHFCLASHCVPIIVPQSWTKCYPLTQTATMFGRILERKTRQGHCFDPDLHNIYVIQSMDILKGGEAADGGPSVVVAARCRHTDVSVRRLAVQHARDFTGTDVQVQWRFYSTVQTSKSKDIHMQHADETAFEDEARAFEALMRCLEDTDAAVRFHAVSGVRRILSLCDPNLRRSEPNPFDRDANLSHTSRSLSLGKPYRMYNRPGVGKLWESWYDMPKKKALKLVKVHRPALQVALIRCLEDADEKMRSAADQLLTSLQDIEAFV